MQLYLTYILACLLGFIKHAVGSSTHASHAFRLEGDIPEWQTYLTTSMIRLWPLFLLPRLPLVQYDMHREHEKQADPEFWGAIKQFMDAVAFLLMFESSELTNVEG